MSGIKSSRIADLPYPLLKVNSLKYSQNTSFDPTNVEGLDLWLDASDEDTVFSDVWMLEKAGPDQGVALWADKSGNERHFSQINTSLRPTKKPKAQRGLDSILFNGSRLLGDFKKAVPQPITIFMVAKSNLYSGSFNYRLFDGQESTFILGVNDSSRSWFTNLGQHVDYKDRDFGWNVHTLAANNNSQTTAYTNQHDYLVSSGGNSLGPNIAVGNAYTDARPWNGHISEIIIYFRALSETEIGQIQRYLRNKWVGDIKKPTDLSGCGLWLDAEDSSTLIKNSKSETCRIGDSVFAWRDKSGAQRDFWQNSVAKRPVLQLDEGKRGVRFDGVDDTLEIVSGLDLLRNVGGATVFTVAEHEGFSGARVEFFSSTASSSTASRLNVNTSESSYVFGGRRLDAQLYQSITSFRHAAPGLHVKSGVFLYSATELQAFVNGSPTVKNNTFQTAGNTSNTNSLVIIIGSGVNANFMQGRICEVIVYRRALSALEREQVEEYLQKKWNTPKLYERSVPEKVMGAALWLDAADETTLFDATSGGALVAPDGQVARWEDKSGNGRHATNGTASARPLRKIGIQNSQGVIRFDGSDDWMSLPGSIASLNSISAFAVVNYNNTTSQYFTLSGRNSGTGTSKRFYIWSFEEFRYGVGTTVTNLTAPNNADWNIHFLSHGNNLQSAWLNGEGVGVVEQLDEQTPERWAVGALVNVNGVGSLYFLGGDIAEILIYNRALDSTERAKIEAYLQNKWGTPSLPKFQIHPFAPAQATLNEPYYFSIPHVARATNYEWTIESGQLPAGLSLTQKGEIKGTPTEYDERALTVRVGLGSEFDEREIRVAVVLDGLGLWLDAADPNTLFDATTGGSLVAADGAVARWEDKSGNGRHATQNTSGSRPLRKIALYNSRDALKFDGSDDRLILPSSWFSLGSVTLFAVAKQDSDLPSGHSGSQFVFAARSFLNGNTLSRFYMRRVESSGLLFFDTGDTISSVSFLAPEAPFIGTAMHDGNKFNAWLNGEVGGEQTNESSSSPGFLTIGDLAPLDATNRTLKGDIAEIVIYNRALDATERHQVEEYLQAKWATPTLPLTILTSSPPSATKGTPYSFWLKASSAATWTLESGALPAGLTLSSSGRISGTATETGAFVFEVKAAAGAEEATKTFTLKSVISSPLEVQNCELWLDAADENTLYDTVFGGSKVEADGAVARWEDKSGNGRHATQGTSGSRPTRKIGTVNELDSLRFNGSSNSLLIPENQLTLPLANDPYSIIAVFMPTASGNRSLVVQAPGAIDNAAVYFRALNTYALNSGFYNNNLTSANNVLSDGQWSVGLNTYGVTGRKLFVDGVQVGSDGISNKNSLSADTWIGSENGSANFWAGDIAEVVIFHKELNSTERRQVEEYLQNKWGTPELPA